MKAEKGTRVDSYGTLNEVLVNLFRDVMEIEQRALESSEFQDLTNNDMHVIEAIGIQEPKNMSTIARTLSVTVGTLTIAMNSLVKKGYVIRQRGQTDRRVVYISLSEKGKAAYQHHARFHQEMIQSIVEQLTEDELAALTKALTCLDHWFREKDSS
ncbi:MAG TPA: MarR family transcriptional regulator [Candidatus Caccovicinus merdipullorum]|uniref:MarR family transcriptional regulator n=1 Tax=Candidatus Caccovicinus merdipullorum TaxID=2840724 RepID=A0A9D1KHB7_9FIRM|nr:MarR family transcriptional regulator [Candidatus Caccovicinus merdipullorum]